MGHETILTLVHKVLQVRLAHKGRKVRRGPKGRQVTRACWKPRSQRSNQASLRYRTKSRACKLSWQRP